MIKTIGVFFSALLLTSLLYGGEDFSEMSTQELLSIIGYVKQDDSKEFKKELESRLPNMSASEKEIYKKNLDKLK